MLIDSNIMVYALTSNSPKQRAAQMFIQKQQERIFAQQNIFESLRILTHSRFSNPYPALEAIQAIQAITHAGTIITPLPETESVALALIEKYNINGSEIFDAYLVATALSNSVRTIATDNVKHLSKYEEVRVINPF